MNRGGKRKGSGRKAKDIKRKAIGVVLEPETIAMLNARVPANKRSAYIETILLEELKQQQSNTNTK